MNPKSGETSDIYSKIGEVGPYQITMVLLISFSGFISSMIPYSYVFYAAVPSHRCKLPDYPNDTYEISGDYHSNLVQKYIPLSKENSLNEIYDNCHLISYENVTEAGNVSKLVECDEWVYSKEFYERTIISEWDLVCSKTGVKSLLQTLFFTASYLLFILGMLSDKYGRQRISYIFIVINVVISVFMSIMMNTSLLSKETEKIVFMIIRVISGFTSDLYSVTMILAIEFCGSSKSVFAANFAYYFYILGELVVVIQAYFARSYGTLILCNTIVYITIASYFWSIPESPKWQMCNNQQAKAMKTLQRIAKSNKREFESLDEVEMLKKDEKSQLFENADLRFWSVTKKLFASRKVTIYLIVTYLNWFSNNLVYFGISFSTSQLPGNPYVNFALSVVAEFLAVLCCDLTLNRFGRKIPCSINIVLAGLVLLLVQLIPSNMPNMITALVLFGKFSISFAHNGLYIITAERSPTVIRNTLFSLLQTLGGVGTIVSPYVQLMGESWFVLPYIIYGVCSAVAAITFVLFIPETRGKPLPDTIDEFIESA